MEDMPDSQGCLICAGCKHNFSKAAVQAKAGFVEECCEKTKYGEKKALNRMGLFWAFIY